MKSLYREADMKFKLRDLEAELMNELENKSNSLSNYNKEVVISYLKGRIDQLKEDIKL